jgi:hypothetical protein
MLDSHVKDDHAMIESRVFLYAAVFCSFYNKLEQI